MKLYNGIYLGVVVQNNDPEHRGRAKVWVPHINLSIYDKWAGLMKDRSFKFPGKNIDSDLSLIISELKEQLPWAEYSSPLMGETASGIYNAFDDTASVSDATYPFSLSGSNTTTTVPELALNTDKMGEKPGSVYEKYATKLTDAFTDTTSQKTNTVNPYGAEYRPATYSSAAKGLFSIPNVGAHVWVFFRDGIPLYPVYIGTTFSADDYNGIFKSEDGSYQDYPRSFENRTEVFQDKNDNNSIYRSKTVINQRGAAIEIINTTDRERFKVTSFAGGFLELGNKFNAIFSPKNLQLLTARDKFETIRGNNNFFVGRDSDNLIKGNYHLKVGSLNNIALSNWITAYTSVATLLALPEGNASKDGLTDAIKAAAQSLATAEAQLGFGGNSIETITKHKFVNVGMIFNPFASFRYNQTSKTVSRYQNVVSGGTSTVTTTIPQIEYTYIDDMPGGNLTETVGNRWSKLVGAGGIDIKTTGPVTLGGTIMALAGKQFNIAATDDFNIDGGTNLSIIADIMTIRSRSRNQVLIDDNLGISKNVVIGGGLYANGEVYVQHVTAPVEYQLTEKSKISDTTYTITGATITKSGGGVISSGDTINISGGTLAINQTHQHYFKNIPITVLEANTDVRNAAATALNGGTNAATAAAVADGYKANPGARVPPTDPRTN